MKNNSSCNGHIEVKDTTIGCMLKIPCDNHELGDCMWVRVSDIACLGKCSECSCSEYEPRFYVCTQIPLRSGKNENTIFIAEEVYDEIAAYIGIE